MWRIQLSAVFWEYEDMIKSEKKVPTEYVDLFSVMQDLICGE